MSDFSRQLTALDTPSAARKAEHDRAVAALFERNLTPADIARLAFLLLISLAGGLLVASLALTEPATTPLTTRLFLGLLATISLTWTALAGVIFRRGAWNSSLHGSFAANLGFAFSLLTTLAISLLTFTKPLSPTLILLPLATLTLATVILILHHLRQSELRLRRDLLQTQYQLALLTSPPAAS